MAASSRKTTKGELTRQKIIEATLALIANRGLNSLSHRNIANAAQVRLSLTSYYFESMDHLILCAFDEFARREVMQIQWIQQQVDQILERYPVEGEESNRPQCIQELTDLLTEYILTELSDESRRKQLAIRCHFLFALGQSQALIQRVSAYKLQVLNLIKETAIKIGSPSPEVDANLVVFVFREFEFSLVSGDENFNQEIVSETLKRLLSTLMTTPYQ
ncbi:TetR family transcriptional regulator [Photobacterium sp. CCB-ST2H9]|uniref:TetR/AcrR family transcriptional regulator n=1 Tax=Photobacterium sp. CCB-ST2H9 TaxID=2912855 RepID=UPI002006B1BA|nr:TetR family transcriptional regulator [Photobacterium sp. CCB-ST2H9]UTM60083.1 TetR family transcriptional regulator [Photobacterium sp. CCB-ST2H9]